MPERLAALAQHLAHLRELRPRIASADDLRRDLSLHNDVLFSLLIVSQTVIDVASELAARRGLRFETYTDAVRSLAVYPELRPELLREIERLPGFRNVLVHDYVVLDLERVIAALDRLEPVEEFAEIARRLAQ